jgi:hypothetical protein
MRVDQREPAACHSLTNLPKGRNVERHIPFKSGIHLQNLNARRGEPFEPLRVIAVIPFALPARDNRDVMARRCLVERQICDYTACSTLEKSRDMKNLHLLKLLQSQLGFFDAQLDLSMDGR